MKFFFSFILFSITASADYDVPIPNPVQTEINVGTYIFPGWYRDYKTNNPNNSSVETNSEWRLIAKFTKPRPLLGFYDDSLPEVNDWHIKWALEAGISWFAFDWYWNKGEKRLARTLEDGFLNAHYKDMMDFCVHWCNHSLDWSNPLDFSPQALQEMIAYCVSNYFLLPNYLKINNRPVFMIWNMQEVIDANGGADNFKNNVLPTLNSICQNAGLGNLFIVVVVQNPYSFDETGIADANASYSLAGLLTDTKYKVPGSAPYKEMVDLLPGYWEKMRIPEIPYILTTQAGWDNTPRTIGHGNNIPWVRTDNSVEHFEKTLQDGTNVVYTNFPFYIIEAWNEWGEGSFIEPGKQFGFTQLDALRRTFAPLSPTNSWVEPTESQILSYSVLKGDELAAAIARESDTPLPPPPVNPWSTEIEIDPDKFSAEILDTVLFNTIDVISGSAHVDIKGIVNDSLVCEVTGNDPQLIINGDWGSFSDISGIAIKLKYIGTAYNNAELFWQTDLMNMSQETARRYPWFYDNNQHVYLIKFNPDYLRIGTLQVVRIDLPDSQGGIAAIEWMKILGPSNPLILNPSFELKPDLVNWSAIGVAGTDSGWTYRDNAKIPDMEACAYIQETGELSQNVAALNTNKQYWLQIWYNVRAATANCDIGIYFNTQELMLVSNVAPVEVGSADKQFYFTNLVFTPTTSSGDIILKNLDVGTAADRSALFDGIVLIQRDPDEIVIKNPGFEASGIISNINQYGQVFSPRQIAGWEKISWYGIGWVGSAYNGSSVIPDGRFSLFNNQNTGSKQTIENLVPGNTYELSYYYNVRNDLPANSYLQTTINGSVIHDESNIIKGTTYHYTNLTFVASASSTILQFNALAGPDNAVNIDDISIKFIVPEPVVFGLIGCLSALFIARRR